MTLTLIQKLLISVVTLTSFFLIFIGLLHYDLTRKINKSIFQLVPGIIMFVLGIVLSNLLLNPQTIFKTIMPLKSGFAKGVLGSTVFPLIASTVRTMSIIACLTSFIDKFWYYWRSHRLIFIFRLIISISLTIIAGNTLFSIIFFNQKQLCAQILLINRIGFWASVTLGVILLLILILSAPSFFRKRKQEPSA